jgi:hypothetical protein
MDRVTRFEVVIVSTLVGCVIFIAGLMLRTSLPAVATIGAACSLSVYLIGERILVWQASDP